MSGAPVDLITGRRRILPTGDTTRLVSLCWDHQRYGASISHLSPLWPGLASLSRLLGLLHWCLVRWLARSVFSAGGDHNIVCDHLSRVLCAVSGCNGEDKLYGHQPGDQLWDNTDQTKVISDGIKNHIYNYQVVALRLVVRSPDISRRIDLFVVSNGGSKNLDKV